MKMFAFILLDGDNLTGYGHNVGSKFGKPDMDIMSDLIWEGVRTTSEAGLISLICSRISIPVLVSGTMDRNVYNGVFPPRY